MEITDHAKERIEERTSLFVEEVVEKLLKDKYYPIGEDNQLNHTHKIIYSELDKELFVIIQDSSNEDIITCLPLDYHNRWHLSHDIYDIVAKKLNIPKFKAPKESDLTITCRLFCFREKKSLGETTIVKTTKQFKVMSLSKDLLQQIGYPEELKININDIINVVNNSSYFLSNIKKKLKEEANPIITKKIEEFKWEDAKLIKINFDINAQGLSKPCKELGEYKI